MTSLTIPVHENLARNDKTGCQHPTLTILLNSHFYCPAGVLQLWSEQGKWIEISKSLFTFEFKKRFDKSIGLNEEMLFQKAKSIIV